MRRSRSASTLLPVTQGRSREQLFARKRSRSSGIGTLVVLVLFLVLAGCGAVFYYHGGSPVRERRLSSTQRRHQDLLNRHEGARRAEANFEREVKRRQEGREGILTPQQHLRLIEHEEQQGLNAQVQAITQHREHDPDPRQAEQKWNAQQQTPEPSKSIYDLNIQSIMGEVISMERYRGKVLLIVNVASQCGYTQSNYEGLQKLYERYAAYGLEILAFPCNQFGNQESGSLPDILDFATSTYHVTFPLMSKVEVNGPGEAEIFRWLKKNTPLPKGGAADIDWNFNKFLVDKWGNPRSRFRSTMDYAVLANFIYQELVRTAP